MTLHRTPAGRLRPLAVALLALAAILIAATTAQDASAAGRTLNVNPFTGADTNPATAAAPLKTFTKALKLAQAGDTVKLAGGGYGPATSGDVYPAAGLPVRSGVTIVGTLDSGFPVSTLAGPGSGAALNLAGNATVRNLALGGQGFGVGVFANRGSQTLSNLFIGMPAGKTAVIDGATLNGGVFLRGNAQATLNNPNIFLLSGGATGVSANEQARLTINGGTITGGDQPTCLGTATGIALNQAARATLNGLNAPGILNIGGPALRMTGTSTATLNLSLIRRAVPAGCAAGPAVTVDDSATLTMADHSLVARTNGSPTGVGVAMGSSAPLTVREFASINGFAEGITISSVGGTGNINLTNAHLSGCGVCLDLGAAKGSITIDRSSFSAGGGVDKTAIVAPSLFKMRNSDVATANRIGVLITGQGADLGTASDPGNNDLRAFDAGVKVADQVTTTLVHAEGNLWHANTQGSDATGHYTQPLLVNGLSPLARGRNFDVAQFNPKPRVFIRLASVGTVGRLRLTPAVLDARAGKPARLKLSWTHPKAWKQLRTVQLRLYRGTKPVGRIVVRPRGERLTAHGAVSFIADRSRVTHHRKTVTARLAVRLKRSLAGPDLRVDVQATDRDGHTQLERGAGTVRVAK